MYLSWTEVAGATGYILSYAPMPFTGPASIVSVDMGTQKSVSGELPAGTAFYVAVQSRDNTGAKPILQHCIGHHGVVPDRCRCFHDSPEDGFSCSVVFDHDADFRGGSFSVRCFRLQRVAGRARPLFGQADRHHAGRLLGCIGHECGQPFAFLLHDRRPYRR